MKPLDAHQKLMAMLPVRTHRMQGDDPRVNQKKTEDEHEACRIMARALRKKRYTIDKIAEVMKIARATAYNYIRRPR